jgi:hypothetical protein
MQIKCTSGGLSLPHESTTDELATFIGTEIEGALTGYDRSLRRPAIVSSALIAGKVAAAISRLDLDRQKALLADPDVADRAVATLISDLVSEIPGRSHKKRSEKAVAAPPSPDKAVEAPRAPDDLIVANWAGPVAGPTFLEATYGISRSSLHRWQRRNNVIALRSGGRKHVFPLAQFVDGRPVPGIAAVSEMISNPRLAWLWLIRPNPELIGRAPIDLLKLDVVEDVIEAARAHVATGR